MRRVGIYPDSGLCRHGHDLSVVHGGKPYDMHIGQEQ